MSVLKNLICVEYLTDYNRGSVLSQLPGQACVVSTSATMHYGTSAWSAYDSIEDAGQPTEVQRDCSIGVDKVSTVCHYAPKADAANIKLER